jgi:hypothetical protein
MTQKDTIRTTFAQDTKMTPGILRMFSNIAKNSTSSYKKRKQKGQMVSEVLRKAKKQKRRSS